MGTNIGGNRGGSVVDILSSGIEIVIWNLEHKLDSDINFVSCYKSKAKLNMIMLIGSL